MKNFNVNEYFKDYAAVQKEYFSDLKQVTEPKEIGGRLESQVLFNGEGYKKIEHFTDDSMYILLVPNENLQVLPVVEFTATKNHIHVDTFKLINKRTLEHITYISMFEKEDDAFAKLETKYFDVSDEIGNERYVLKYGMLLELGKQIDKELIGKTSIVANKAENRTFFYLNGGIYITSMQENGPLFELLKDFSKEMEEKNKTK